MGQLRAHWQRIAHWLGRALVILAAVYGIGLTLLLVVRLAVGERWMLIAWLNSFLHLLMLPALAIMPISMLRRRWRVAFTQAAGVFTFVGFYGAVFLPQMSSVPPGAPTLSILSYNLKSEAEGLELLAEVIREANADIVAMQEVSEAAAAYLQGEFAGNYPYQAFHPQAWEPIPGQGLLSRYPIESDEYWRIHLGHQRVSIALEGSTLTLYNAHPIQPFVENGFARRAEEITVLLERAANDSGPLILAGDFNMSDQSDDYRRVTAFYTDAYREVGWGLGFTFPDFSYAEAVPEVLPSVSMPVRPAVRLDYIFRNSAFQAQEARVLSSSGGSDHRPVYARLALVIP